LMKKGLRSFSHDQVAAFRIFISFLAFLPWGLKNLKKVTKNNSPKPNDEIYPTY